jgi:REP element-mobilizing transposase RayT
MIEKIFGEINHADKNWIQKRQWRFVYIHAVFSTKDRRPFLNDKEFRNSLHHYMGGISKQLECAPIRVGGVEDHVHILARLGRTITQADWTKEMKRSSNCWLREQSTSLSTFSWQSGYACFSVSVSNLEAVTAYIDGQEEHHRKVTFQDELRIFLKKHGEAWDEKYLWD